MMMNRALLLSGGAKGRTLTVLQKPGGTGGGGDYKTTVHVGFGEMSETVESHTLVLNEPWEFPVPSREIVSLYFTPIRHFNVTVTQNLSPWGEGYIANDHTQSMYIEFTNSDGQHSGGSN